MRYPCRAFAAALVAPMLLSVGCSDSSQVA